MKPRKQEQPERVVAAQAHEEDATLDTSLRPKKLSDFVGQEKVIGNLQIAIAAARKRGDPLDHMLFYGPPGLGKTTLAYIIAAEMGVSLRITAGPSLQRAGDLAAILTNLKADDLLFIDEVHRLTPPVEEVLYPAMEDFAVDIIIGKGPGARSLRLSLPRFTLVGATTRYALLSPPLRDRFGAVYRMDFYSPEAIRRILERSARILGIAAEDDGLWEIARRSRGTPRIANRLLRRVRDFAQVLGEGVINRKAAVEALERLDVDEKGLDLTDHRVLRTIIEKYNGGPVGLETIAASISEEADTIMDVYEPYLMQMGFLGRTPRGRVATRLAYEHLGLPFKEQADTQQAGLF